MFSLEHGLFICNHSVRKTRAITKWEKKTFFLSNHQSTHFTSNTNTVYQHTVEVNSTQ